MTTTVYCPPVVPAPKQGPPRIEYAGPINKAHRGRGYEVQVESGSWLNRESLGHWAFFAGTPAEVSRRLLPYRFRGHRPGILASREIEVAGTPASVKRMAPYPAGGVNGDHVVVLWRMDATAYLISVHGYGNEARVLAMSEGLINLIRNCPAGTSNGDCPAAIRSATPAVQRPVGKGAAVAKCRQAFLGRGGRGDWRENSTYVGPAGFFGPGRDFRRTKYGPVKTPVVVEDRKAVTLAIDPSQRNRAGLLIDGVQRAYARVRFVPCRDREATAWPAGFRLREREPVIVLARVGKGPERRVEVGRP